MGVDRLVVDHETNRKALDVDQPCALRAGPSVRSKPELSSPCVFQTFPRPGEGSATAHGWIAHGLPSVRSFVRSFESTRMEPVNLEQRAEMQGVHYQTAYQWSHEGDLPVPAKCVGPRTILVNPDAATA